MASKEAATDRSKALSSRFVIGTSVFVIGMLSPLFVPLVATSSLSTEWKTALSGALLLGVPEVLMLVAVAILGKPGYEEMKRKLVSFFRRHRPAKYVGPLRHRVGVAMFVLPVLVGWLDPYLALWIAEWAEYEPAFAVILDVCFVSSLFVLGGDFWDKLNALFVRTDPAV